ncbi:MAG: hypothetical protein ABL868_05685 [Sulfuriferula sp.]
MRIGQSKEGIDQKPGEVMGLFAYGHPFLDGNGRTMLIVHSELCYRAGFSIDWSITSKTDYLNALSEEIKNPGCGILDSYLLPFKGNLLDRDSWSKDILSIKGLNGLDDDNQVEGDLSDATVAEKYRQFEQNRGYAYKTHDEQVSKVLFSVLASENLSYMAAKEIGRDKNSCTLAEDGKSYGGKILGVTDSHVVQNLGTTAVIHRQDNLDRIPEEDELVNIE